MSRKNKSKVSSSHCVRPSVATHTFRVTGRSVRPPLLLFAWSPPATGSLLLTHPVGMQRQVFEVIARLKRVRGDVITECFRQLFPISPPPPNFFPPGPGIKYSFGVADRQLKERNDGGESGLGLGFGLGLSHKTDTKSESKVAISLTDSPDPAMITSSVYFRKLQLREVQNSCTQSVQTRWIDQTCTQSVGKATPCVCFFLSSLRFACSTGWPTSFERPLNICILTSASATY